MKNTIISIIALLSLVAVPVSAQTVDATQSLQLQIDSLTGQVRDLQNRIAVLEGSAVKSVTPNQTTIGSNTVGSLGSLNAKVAAANVANQDYPTQDEIKQGDAMIAGFRKVNANPRLVCVSDNGRALRLTDRIFDAMCLESGVHHGQ